MARSQSIMGRVSPYTCRFSLSNRFSDGHGMLYDKCSASSVRRKKFPASKNLNNPPPFHCLMHRGAPVRESKSLCDDVLFMIEGWIVLEHKDVYFGLMSTGCSVMLTTSFSTRSAKILARTRSDPHESYDGSTTYLLCRSMQSASTMCVS